LIAAWQAACPPGSFIRPIVGQTGRAQRAGTGPVRKNTALTRPGPLPHGPVPCLCQRPGRAWAAISARGTSTGTARLRAQHGEARPRPVWHDGGPAGPAPSSPRAGYIRPVGGRSDRCGGGLYKAQRRSFPPPNPNPNHFSPSAGRRSSRSRTLASQSLTLSPLVLSSIFLSSPLPELR